MTDIGVPDPLEPEIDVIPLVDPVPEPSELPEPVHAPEHQPDPKPGMTRREPVLAWRTWRLRISPKPR